MSDIHGDVTVDQVELEEELTGAAGAPATPDVAEYALWLGDDSLILAQQLGMWIARAPELEEDVALANIALDLLGHARSLLHYAGSGTPAAAAGAGAGTAAGRTEDDLAYWRDEAEFRCLWLFQQPNGDFAHTIARQLAASGYLFELYAALQESADATLAAIAAKAVKEVDYHRDHAVQWTLRLAGGTDESRRRMIRAVSDVWPYVDELFRDEDLTDRLAASGIVPRPSGLRAGFDAMIGAVFAEAALEVPAGFSASGGGRHGTHFSTLGYLLAEMQVLARQHPGGDVVSRIEASTHAWEIAAAVTDPEIPVLTIEDLGVLRTVETTGERVTVTITPTYSGCPAMEAIRDDIILALTAAGFDEVDVRLTLSPAWTTDWMSDDGKRKLVEYGIAPPSGRASVGRAGVRPAAVGPIKLALGVKCPRCGSLATREVTRFGSTSCKALYECRMCLEPFDYFKVH